MLPGERVEQRHHCEHAAGQGAGDERAKKKKTQEKNNTPSITFTHIHTQRPTPCRGHTRLNQTRSKQADVSVDNEKSLFLKAESGAMCCWVHFPINTSYCYELKAGKYINNLLKMWNWAAF